MRLDQRLAGVVPAHLRDRGEEYFREGRVEIQEVDEDGVSATVRGSQEYHVFIHQNRQRFEAACCCAYFTDRNSICKHIWAAVCAVAVENLYDSVSASTITPNPRLQVHGDSPAPSNVVDLSRSPRAPIAASRWRTLLSRLNEDSSQRGELPPIPEEILYVVDAVLTTSSIRLLVMGRSHRKDGEWRRPKPLRLRPTQISDLEPFDREIMSLLSNNSVALTAFETGESFLVSPLAAGFFIPRLASAGKLFLREAVDDEHPRSLKWDAQPWTLHVGIDSEERSETYKLEGEFRRGDQTMDLRVPILVADGFLFTDTAVAPFTSESGFGWIRPLRELGEVEIPKKDREAFVAELAAVAPSKIDLPPDLQCDIIDSPPIPVLSLWSSKTDIGWLEGRLSFQYADQRIDPASRVRVWRDGRHFVRRDLEREDRYIARLASFSFTRDTLRGLLRIHPTVLAETASRLVTEGWDLEVDSRRVVVADEFFSEISSGIDWFDLHAGARFGDVKVELPDLLDAVRQRRSFLQLPGGRYAAVPEKWVEQFSTISDFGIETEGGLRFRHYQASLVDALLGARDEVKFDARFEELRVGSASWKEIKPEHEPATFRGELRDYQREGLGWLRFLRDLRLGGCLADDMGLGKTVQVLAMLDSLQGSGPTLVVAPRSLIFNWRQEAVRFTPRLKVLEHLDERQPGFEHFKEYDIVLTTYGVLRRDIAHLSAAEFHYVILDEAQAIKNSSSQAAKAVRLLKSKHRLALSGTPIENHLSELWSISEFLNPGMLGSARYFSRTFARKNAPPESRALLAKALRPFILRRTKSQVAPELPPRVEQTLVCELDAPQRAIYDQLREYYRTSLLSTVKEQGVAKSKMLVLEALLRLRQAACHPALIDPKSDAPSAKLDALIPELEAVIDSGHKALVFSQFTSFLGILREQLDHARIKYAYLDGATRDRQEVVSRFESEKSTRLFLISLKAGGVGLNLTSADYVFLLDPWWNPAVEAQAIDRTHRIGQTQSVFAYRLIAKDTVEEKILELQKSKRELAESIITEDNSVLRSLEVEDLEMLLS